MNGRNQIFLSFYEQKMKGLIRKRSTTAARLQRAFSSKGLRNPPTSASSPSSSSDMTDNSTSVSTSAHSTPVKTGVDKRQFIMETAVQFINVSFGFRRNVCRMLRLICLFVCFLLPRRRDCKVKIGTCFSSTICC